MEITRATGKAIGLVLGCAVTLASPTGCSPDRQRVVVLPPTTITTVEQTVPVGPQQCGFVTFAPNSGYGAFKIVAVGVTCSAARDVASASKGLNAQNFDTAEFNCPTPAAGPTTEKFYWRYRCANSSGASVTFQYSPG